MTRAEVKVGSVYLVTVSGNRCAVRVDAKIEREILKRYGYQDYRWAPDIYWEGTNLRTGKKIRIDSAQRLQRELTCPAVIAVYSGKRP